MLQRFWREAQGGKAWKINSAYYWGVAKKQDFPAENWPEIILVGRSNVGKSSLINCLLRRRRLAHTSNTPGKTCLLHFYAINDSFFLVDAPGYGYARVSKEKRRQWAFLLEPYLEKKKGKPCWGHCSWWTCAIPLLLVMK